MVPFMIFDFYYISPFENRAYFFREIFSHVAKNVGRESNHLYYPPNIHHHHNFTLSHPHHQTINTIISLSAINHRNMYVRVMFFFLKSIHQFHYTQKVFIVLVLVSIY